MDNFKLQRCSKQNSVNITSYPQGFSTFSWPMSSYRWGIKGDTQKQVVLLNSLSSVSWGGGSRPSRRMLPRVPGVHGQLLVSGMAHSVYSGQSPDSRAEWDRTLRAHTHTHTHTRTHACTKCHGVHALCRMASGFCHYHSLGGLIYICIWQLTANFSTW